jgi:hypothetical protein
LVRWLPLPPRRTRQPNTADAGFAIQKTKQHKRSQLLQLGAD